jgi:hypothetical protein
MRKILFGLAALTLVAFGSLAPAKAQMSGGITLDHQGGRYDGGHDRKYGGDYDRKYGGDYNRNGGDYSRKYGGDYNRKYGGDYNNGYQHYRQN